MPRQPFTVAMPAERSTSAIFASPHSGRDYGWSFRRRSVLDATALRSSEDAFVDLLFAAAPESGAPFLTAEAPRALIDVNRGRDELDPALIEGVAKGAMNPRVTSGLGVIPRVVANGREIYRGKLTMAEAETRLRDYWQPYHDALQGLIDGALKDFGQAILIDCHSMPHEALVNLSRGAGRTPEIVLGDRFGLSAGGEIVERIEKAFADEGFAVARNKPFAGAFTAQHYGKPQRGQHVVQIEIDRALYMNEKTIRPNGNFRNLQNILTGIVAMIADMGRAAGELAAE